jgi:hypothetical protein
MDYFIINKEKIKYTKSHRKALMKCIKDSKISIIKAYGQDMYTALIERAKVHDMDKIAYLHSMLESKAKEIHNKYAGHHLNNNPSLEDMVEAVFDWECARFTKPDKPMNAYQTLLNIYPNSEYFSSIETIIEELCLKK